MDYLIANIDAMSSVSETCSSQKTVPMKESGGQGISFDNFLQKEIGRQQELKFSKHAEDRMIQREMQLSGTEMKKLSEAVDKAEQKGVKNTLVLMDEMAFIVNIPNNVVITAMKGQDLKENIFTQIDGAVIV